MSRPDFDFANVLLVDGDPASRLTLKTVLELSGYHVECAATAAEAVTKMDEREFELVLSDLVMESPDAGLKVLAHAKLMAYQPATALLTTERNTAVKRASRVLIKPEDVPDLLGKVAELIGARATRKVHRELRLAGMVG